MKIAGWLRTNPGRRFVIGVPYVWLLLFCALPFLILLRISVTDMGNGVDPFAPLIETVAGSWRIMLRFGNYVSIFADAGKGAASEFGDTLYLEAYSTSLKYAS